MRCVPRGCWSQGPAGLRAPVLSSVPSTRGCSFAWHLQPRCQPPWGCQRGVGRGSACTSEPVHVCGYMQAIVRLHVCMSKARSQPHEQLVLTVGQSISMQHSKPWHCRGTSLALGSAHEPRCRFPMPADAHRWMHALESAVPKPKFPALFNLKSLNSHAPGVLLHSWHHAQPSTLSHASTLSQSMCSPVQAQEVVAWPHVWHPFQQSPFPRTAASIRSSPGRAPLPAGPPIPATSDALRDGRCAPSPSWRI